MIVCDLFFCKIPKVCWPDCFLVRFIEVRVLIFNCIRQVSPATQTFLVFQNYENSVSMINVEVKDLTASVLIYSILVCVKLRPNTYYFDRAMNTELYF